MERSNDSGSNMKWTKKKPTVPGWYWRRKLEWDELRTSIVEVRLYSGKMCIENWKIPDDGEWAGPISEPKE